MYSGVDFCAHPIVTSIVGRCCRFSKPLPDPRRSIQAILDHVGPRRAIGAWICVGVFVTLPQVSAFSLCAGILGALSSHKVVMEIKAALGAVAARSFLQDCLLIIIPIFIAINIAWDQPLNLTIAFLGLLLPLYGGIVRIGCFLGGCCYGKPSQYGVLYPESIFTLERNGWRRYSPSPDPRQRVFPIQLVESGAQLSLFAVLTFILWERPQADRYIFPLYLMLYAITRLGLDCYRVTSARPRYGRFSEAQLVCVCVLAAACLYLAYMLMN